MKIKYDGANIIVYVMVTFFYFPDLINVKC